MVGPEEVLQQTPRAVTDAAQSPLILPPDDADVEAITEIDVVEIDGVTVPVVNGISAP